MVTRCLLLAISAAALSLHAQDLKVCGSVPLYEPCEIEFEMTEAEAAQHPNPYLTAEVRAEFRSPIQRFLPPLDRTGVMLR